MKLLMKGQPMSDQVLQAAQIVGFAILGGIGGWCVVLLFRNLGPR